MNKSTTIQNNKIEIEYLPTHSLTPYSENSKSHGRASVESIKASIAESGGFNDPIAIWGPDNIIVEGHGRYYAAVEMGIESVPCIRLDYLSDAQRRAYTISHNRTTEFSDWNKEELEHEVKRIRSGLKSMKYFDISDFGSSFTVENEVTDDDKTRVLKTVVRCPHCKKNTAARVEALVKQ